MAPEFRNAKKKFFDIISRGGDEDYNNQSNKEKRRDKSRCIAFKRELVNEYR